MPRLLAPLLACLALCASLAAAALQVENVAAGKAPLHVAVDAATGRAFVASPGNPRAAEPPSIVVLELNGRSVTLPTAAAAAQVAVSGAFRRAVAVHPAAGFATLIDVDTLQVRTVTTGLNPSRVVISERAGMAFVLGRGAVTALGTGSGTVTLIDLRSGLARTYLVEGFTPENAVAGADGTRLYILGTMPQPASEWLPGYVQAFDTVARQMLGEPVPLGRMPRHIAASSAGDEIYVLGHVDHVRSEPRAADPRRGSLRPVLFTLETASLALRRVVALPETRDPEAHGAMFTGRVEIDPASNTLYLLDTPNERLLLLAPGARQAKAVDLEAPGHALAVNPVAGTLLVSFPTEGHLGVFSLAGERLDTLRLSRPPGANEFPASHAIAVDSATGTAYVTQGHTGSVAVVRRNAAEGPAQLVNYTDLWFDPSRPGSGVFLDQQGASLFAALFIHDPRGQPVWLFMSNGTRQPDGSFAGDLYRTRGPLAETTRNAAAVGTLRFHPGRGDTATLIYYLDGGLHSRLVQRFRVSEAARECRWKVGSPTAAGERGNFTALWSNPADPGWGVAVSHQGDTAFAVLLTYDEHNRASWMVMSNGKRGPNGQFTGDVYRAAEGRIEVAGTMALVFSGPESGTLRYRLSGLDFQGPILRQTFSRLTTHCSS